MSVEIKPQTLRGPWNSGFALHVHALSSTYLGDDEYGHPRFLTTRSPAGELLYQLKYRQDKSAIAQLAEAAADFCQNKWRLKIDAIIPVPPTQARRVQPVQVVAEALAALLHVPLCAGLKKVKKTPQLKDLTDYHERRKRCGTLSRSTRTKRRASASCCLMIFTVQERRCGRSQKPY